MPVKDKDGNTNMVPINIYDQSKRVDRGPSDCGGVNHAFEIETIDRVLTLYSQDADLMQKFVYYLNTMLQLKNDCLAQQLRLDQEMRSIQRKFTMAQGTKLNALSNPCQLDMNQTFSHFKKDSLVTSISMLYSQPLSPDAIA